MELTVLGCYGPYPPAGGACSGYLLQESGCSILIDCGNGVLSRLQEHLRFIELDAVILSHLHADHYSDIMIMRYGLEIAYNKGLRTAPLPLYAPGEPQAEFERLPYKNAYSVNKINDQESFKIGPFTITVQAGVHAVKSYSLRLQSPAGVLVYSGDTEDYSGLEMFAGDADLFLCEANYLQAEIENGLPNHLSAAQAGRIAALAGAKKLLLTHHHAERDLLLLLSEAEKHFPGAQMAREGEKYQV